MKIPFFSVVIPVYNKANHLKTCVDSVLNQTFEDYEIILINDGSTDAISEVLQTFNASNILIYNTKNQGVSAARNLGISESNGTHIAFLDADDTWTNRHLQQLSDLISDFPNCGLYATNYSQIKGNSKGRINHFPTLPTKFRGIVPSFFKESYYDRIAWTSAVSVPKSVFNSVKPFDESLHPAMGEDLDLWIRIALKFPVAFDSEISAFHHLSAKNRLSLKNASEKKFPLLNQFQTEELSNPELKRFLDLYRAEFALKLKLVADKRWKFYYGEIDLNQLPKKTKWLLEQPNWIINSMYRIKKFGEIFGWKTSAYH